MRPCGSSLGRRGPRGLLSRFQSLCGPEQAPVLLGLTEAPSHRGLLGLSKALLPGWGRVEPSQLLPPLGQNCDLLFSQKGWGWALLAEVYLPGVPDAATHPLTMSPHPSPQDGCAHLTDDGAKARGPEGTPSSGPRAKPNQKHTRVHHAPSPRCSRPHLSPDWAPPSASRAGPAAQPRAGPGGRRAVLGGQCLVLSWQKPAGPGVRHGGRRRSAPPPLRSSVLLLVC